MTPGLCLAHFVESPGEQLHDMEPVYGHVGIGEGLADRRQEGGRHVANDLGDPAWFAIVRDQKVLESTYRFLAFVRHSKHHRSRFTIQVNEDGDVVVPPFRSRFIKGDRFQVGKIEPFQRSSNVVSDDPPQPLIGDTHLSRRSQHRHFARQHQRRLLEQQGKAAPLPRPRHPDPLDPMLRAVRPRHSCGDVAVVLKKVQMPPAELTKIMGLATAAKFRAGEHRPAVSFQGQVQFVRRLLNLQVLAHQAPRLRHTKTQRQYLARVHQTLLPKQAKG